MLQVHIGNIGETFNASQIIGKNLKAAVNINVRRTADVSSPSNILYVAKAGEIIGNVYSYVYGKGKDAAKIFWMLDKDQSHPYRFVLHNPNAFHFQNLKDQGSKTIKEETEEQKKKEAENSGSWFDNLNVPDLLKKGAYIVGGLLLGKWIIEAAMSNKK